MFGVDFPAYYFFGNSVQDYAQAGALFLVLSFGLLIFENIVVARLAVLAQRTNNDLDDQLLSVVSSIRPHIYIGISFLVAVKMLALSPVVDQVAVAALYALVIFQVVKSLNVLIVYAGDKVALKEKEGTKEAVRLVTKILKGVLWVLGLLLFMQNVGINVTSLIAGLGIGGVAIALAAQNILGDLFSSFAIIFDKPFVPGDFIIVGEHMGVVEKVGIKTTRIKALQGEEIVISNQELTSTRIQNFKKLQERRVVFKFGVVYRTSSAKLKKIPSLIEKIINGVDKTRFDRAHFMAFSDSSLDFEVVYFVDDSDYNIYMDIQQEVLQQVKSVFEKEEIDMAYPTRTVIVEKKS